MPWHQRRQWLPRGNCPRPFSCLRGVDNAEKALTHLGSSRQLAALIVGAPNGSGIVFGDCDHGGSMAAGALLGKVERGVSWWLGRTRNRRDHGPQNLALLRRLAINLAKLEGSKGSMKGKLKKAGWDDAFLISLLAQFGKTQMR